MHALLLILFAALAQVSAGLPEVVPIQDDDLQTHVITLEDGTEYYGTYEETATQITITVDAPWVPQPQQHRTLLRNVRETRRELDHLRHERRVRQARKAGYAYVETPGGAFFVLEESKRFADRAQQLAAQADKMTPAPVAQEEAPEAQPAKAAAKASGSLARYGWYAAIVGIGLVMLTVVVRKLILGP